MEKSYSLQVEQKNKVNKSRVEKIFNDDTIGYAFKSDVKALAKITLDVLFKLDELETRINDLESR